MASLHNKPQFRRPAWDQVWSKAASDIWCGDPRTLWDELWPKFNLVTIPLLDVTAFFADAVANAKVARGRAELEELMSKKRDERIEELRDVLAEMGVAILKRTHKLEFKAAEGAALKIVQTNSFDSILQFICGCMFGWRDEPTDNREPRPRSPMSDTELPRSYTESELEEMSFTQPDENWTPSPSPGRFPPPPRPEPPMFPGSSDYMTRVSAAPPMLNEGEVDENVEQASPTLAETRMTDSDTGNSETAYLGCISADLRSAHAALNNAINREVPPEDLSSDEVDDNRPPPIEHRLSRNKSVGIDADPVSRKRQRYNSEEETDIEVDDRRRKRNKQHYRSSPAEVDENEIIQRASVTDVKPTIGTATLEKATVDGISVDDVENNIGQITAETCTQGEEVISHSATQVETDIIETGAKG